MKSLWDDRIGEGQSLDDCLELDLFHCLEDVVDPLSPTKPDVFGYSPVTRRRSSTSRAFRARMLAGYLERGQVAFGSE